MPKHRKSAKKAAAGRVAAASRLRDENGKFIKASTQTDTEIEKVPEIKAASQISQSVVASKSPEREFTNRYYDANNLRDTPKRSGDAFWHNALPLSSSGDKTELDIGNIAMKSETKTAYRPRTARAMARKMRTGDI